MPVILPEQQHAAWLGETDDGNLKALLLPYPADQMRMWEISPRVNSQKNDDSSLWEPLHAQPTQTTTDAFELLREVCRSPPSSRAAHRQNHKYGATGLKLFFSRRTAQTDDGMPLFTENFFENRVVFTTAGFWQPLP
jgi:hypothetical protein